MDVFKLLFSFEGRIGRLVFAAATTVLYVVAAPIALMLGAPVTWMHAPVGYKVVLLAFAVPHLALSVKRAHDLDRSAWWLVGWTLALFAAVAMAIGAFISMFTPGHLTTVGLAGGALLLGVGAVWQLFVKMYLFAGTPGSNDYGQPCRLLHDLLSDDRLSPPEPAPRDLVAATDSRRPVIAAGAAIPAPGRSAGAPRQPAVTPAGFGRRNGARPVHS